MFFFKYREPISDFRDLQVSRTNTVIAQIKKNKKKCE
jgi:hypothetical protein